MSFRTIENGSIQDISKLTIIEDGRVILPIEDNKKESIITKIKNKLFRRK